MTTLVTGAAGFVGARVCAALHEAGDVVHALVRPGTDPSRLEDAGATVHRVDLHDTVGVAARLAATRPDTVVHAAASRGHGAGGRSALWHDTVTATVSLLDALDSCPPARLLHLGSSTEYAPSDEPLREDDPRPPVNPRGAAKAAAWLAVREWAVARGVPVTSLRLFRVYGAEEPPGRLVPAILHALDGGAPVPLPAGPVARDWVHVDDVAEACLRAVLDRGAAALAQTGPRAVVLNVGRGESLPPQAVVEAFAQAAGREVPVLPGGWTDTRLDVPHWCADLSALVGAWGWRPAIDLREGAERTLQAHRSRQHATVAR